MQMYATALDIVETVLYTCGRTASCRNRAQCEVRAYKTAGRNGDRRARAWAGGREGTRGEGAVAARFVLDAMRTYVRVAPERIFARSHVISAAARFDCLRMRFLISSNNSGECQCVIAEHRGEKSSVWVGLCATD